MLIGRWLRADCAPSVATQATVLCIAVENRLLFGSRLPDPFNEEAPSA
jgi:hypothetical protein